MIGFIVGFSDELIHFYVLSPDIFRLNGYTTVRTLDIKDYRNFNPDCPSDAEGGGQILLGFYCFRND